MTEDDKALVEALRDKRRLLFTYDLKAAADKIEQLSAAIAWKDAALRKIRDGAYLNPAHTQRIANEALEEHHDRG